MALLDFFRGGSAQDRFARTVTARLRRAGWATPLDYDRDRFELDTGTALGRVYLGNMFNGWKSAADSAARDTEFDKIVSFFLEAAAGVPDELPLDRLLPIVRNRGDIENIWADERFAATDPTYAGAMQPLCEVMAVLVAADSEHGIRLLSAQALADGGLDFDAALERALDNLRAASPCHFERQDGGFHISAYGDHYDSSRVLLPHLFGQLGLKGDPVAIVFERRSILVAGSRDRDALTAMAAAVQAWLPEADRPVSCLPIVLRDGRWTPFDAEEAGVPALHAVRGQQWGWTYGDQKSLLEALHARTGEDIFVASLMLIEHHGWLRTLTTWTTDALSLLPKADVVMIGASGGGPSIARSWKSIEQVLGPLTPEPGMWPLRYRIDGPALLAAVDRLAEEHLCPPWFFEPA